MKRFFVSMLTLGGIFAFTSTVDPGDFQNPTYAPSGIEMHQMDVSNLNHPGEVVVDLIDNAADHYLDDLYGVTGEVFTWASPDSRDDALAVATVVNVRATVEALRNLPYVEAAEENIQLFNTGIVVNFPSEPNDPLYEKQWHMDAIGTPSTWTSSNNGEGVVVAVLDTGVSKVEDLDPKRFVPGRNFAGRDPNNTNDGHGHGTHVAGTIAQTTNNGVGVAGVAPLALIMPVKVLSDSGGGTVSGIADGIDWAVDNGAKIINMSLGGGYSEVIHKAVQQASDRGVLVISACGNSDRNKCDFPGGLKENIGVSATGPNGERSFYSSWGKGVNISAPGGDSQFGEGGLVLQNTIQGGKEGYYGFQGTSMATPHVAGAAAVLMSHGLNAAETEALLYASADGDEWSEVHGNGKMNLSAAVASLTGFSSGLTPVQSGFLGLYTSLLLLWCLISGRTSYNFGVRTGLATTGLALGGAPIVSAALPHLETGLVKTVLGFFAMPPVIGFWNLVGGYVPFSGYVSLLYFSPLIPIAFGYVFGISKFLRPFCVALGLAWVVSILGVLSFGWVIPDPSVFTKSYLYGSAVVIVFFVSGLIGVQRLDEKQ